MSKLHFQNILKKIATQSKTIWQSLKKQSQKLKLKHILAFAALTLLITVLVFAQWIQQINSEIEAQLEKKRFSPPVEFYSAPTKFFRGLKITENEILSAFEQASYKQIPIDRDLQNKTYQKLDSSQCSFRVNLEDTPTYCIVFKKADFQHLFAVGADQKILEVFDDLEKTAISVTELEPILFAQFYGKEPILRTRIELGDTPPICLNAILAIEDSKFLEHQGVSFLGIIRAFFKNLFAGRVVQGGSTITQQLVKNYFLTHERKFSRKFKEIFMALLLEAKTSKDDILEAYINEIYMGQNGSFQIRGFGAASEYYFGKSLLDLNLPECSLIAAIVNSPGLFNPFKHPEKAIERRNLVLSKLLESQIITPEEKLLAESVELPKHPDKILSEPAPYFVDAVNREIEAMGIDTSLGLKIETTLNLQAQEAAQKAVSQGLDRLEKEQKQLKKFLDAGKSLEGFLISSDPTNGHIQAIVGGRSFRKSQFNRAIQARRQVGSTMKPFVFLAALDAQDDEGNPYTPLTLLNDEKFKVKYDNQQWAPKNYKNKYYGTIPFYFALKNSLNAATASLGIKIGLESIIDVARQAGIETPLQPFPALTLGAFELPAFEVLQAYNTLSRIGERVPLTMIRSIKSLDDEILYEHQIERSQALDPISTSVLVGMMKQTLQNGTAIAAKLWGFTHPAAGKTGTTDDYKDAWFAGFTPLHTAVVWVGYDDNTAHDMTGGSAAVPIWTQYMMEYAQKFPPIDFQWAEDTETKTISVEDQKSLGVPEEDKRPLEDIELIFKD